MIFEVRLYNFRNNEMKIFSKNKKILNKNDALKFLYKWYRKNPYAKRINHDWICCDYRVDQQRPQRNVYSEAYIKIVSMTEMEEKFIDNTIKNIERKIDYPTCWDDGEKIYYEETIICPECGERRKVLTSHTHCEHCGFKFEDALKCPECGMLNLKGSENCKKCDYEFRKESFINNNDFEVKKNKYMDKIICPECGEIKSKYFDKCQGCGFDYNNKKMCPHCGLWLGKNDNYCANCGCKLNSVVECSVCGKKNSINNRFCNYCGNKI